MAINDLPMVTINVDTSEYLATLAMMQKKIASSVIIPDGCLLASNKPDEPIKSRFEILDIR